jgi:hypothetical protein
MLPRHAHFDDGWGLCHVESLQTGQYAPSGWKNGKRDLDSQDRPSAMDFPQNYGGHYLDLGLGISATVPTGAFASKRLAFEWLQPIYTNVNGFQLDRDGALSFTWSFGF